MQRAFRYERMKYKLGIRQAGVSLRIGVVSQGSCWICCRMETLEFITNGMQLEGYCPRREQTLAAQETQKVKLTQVGRVEIGNRHNPDFMLKATFLTIVTSTFLQININLIILQNLS